VAATTGALLECGGESFGAGDEVGVLGPGQQSGGGLAVEGFERVAVEGLDELLVEVELDGAAGGIGRRGEGAVVVED
jgi:hypothetical protein